MKRSEPVQIESVEGIDVSYLSQQVSAACDAFLRKRGLICEKGWGPKERRPAGKQNQKPRAPP